MLQITGFTLVLDESSLIQNGKAKRSRFILNLKSENVILLSGTPCAGKYENLWTQAMLLGWKITESLYNSQFVNWNKLRLGNTFIRVVDKIHPYKNVERLKYKFREHGAVFMLTDEAFELPEQTVCDVNVYNSKEYRKFKKNQLVEVDGRELVGDTALTKLLYERMLCGAYSKEKLNSFSDILDSTNDRLIVFYNFNDEMEKLKEIVQKKERPLSIVNGATNDLFAYNNRTDSITLIQYQAGAMGLNLQKANKIIYYSPPLSSELYLQSKKRIHRIGQKNSCFYYRMIVNDSVEIDIYNVLEKRKNFTLRLFEERQTK